MYRLTDEQLAFKQKVRTFVDQEVRPVAAELESSAAFPYHIVTRCGELGFLDILLASGDPLRKKKATAGVIFLEEISRGLGSMGTIFAPQFQGCDLIDAAAAEPLRSNVLVPALGGEKILSYATSERSGGTNALDINTTAIRDGDTWLLNGEKSWVTNAGVSDGYLIIAKTAANSQRRSISFFYVDQSDPGLLPDEPDKMLGLASSTMGSIRLQNCRIPADRLIGAQNEGYTLMKSTFNQGRLLIGAAAVGVAQRALELALHYSSRREHFGRRLCSYQGISFPMASMQASIVMSRNMAYHVASLCEDGLPYAAEASMFKMSACEMCCKVCAQAMEIHGAYGLSKASEIERCLRDAHMLTIAGGTAQACSLIVSAALHHAAQKKEDLP